VESHPLSVLTLWDSGTTGYVGGGLHKNAFAPIMSDANTKTKIRKPEAL